MKRWKKIILSCCFGIVSLWIAFYGYAYFDKLPLDEQRKNITIYDTNGKVMYESNFKKNMQWTPISDIPEFIQKAFVSIEDKRFYVHAGFDPIRLTKALTTNFLNQDILQGGSTITQQYAKNLFLTNEQTIQRKLHEFTYATRLEMQYSKDEILEGYLNTIYFGHGIYGVKSAASYFFDKELNDLSISEIALLIGIPNGPSIYSPFLNQERSLKRKALILTQLNKNDVITNKQLELAKNEDLNLAKVEQKANVGIDEYYIDAVIAEIQKRDIDLESEVHVNTYYDPDVQTNLNNSILKYVDMTDEIEVAGVIIQPFTGNILAMAGGKDYTISQYNRAMYASRQAASTIKPLLYYCALQQGFTPSSQFSSEKTTFHISDNQEYSPSNYGNVYANANISMVNAISLSDNIYAEKMHLFLGINTLHQALLDFGITQSKPTPSQALGTVNMSLLELSRIYNTFASEGLYNKPSLIKSITSKNKTLYKRSSSMKRLLQRDDTLILNQLLTSTYDIKNQSYTFPSMYGYQPSVPVAIKSGTSDWDSLVMGFNPEYTIGIWSGFDDNRNLKNKYYSISKYIFKDVFNNLYKDRKGIWYQPSDSIIEKTINPITGEEKSNGSTYWYKKS